MRRWHRLLPLALILAAPAGVLAQLAPDVLARGEEHEAFLRTAKVVQARQLSEDEAVTRPYCLTLEDGSGVRHRALWKNCFGKMHGFWEGWQYEIAAYRLDRLLGLGMVPPTVERSYEGHNGSCQLWLEDTPTGQQMQRSEARIPADRIDAWQRALALQEAFDNLIGNEDRILRNVLVTGDFRLILIDHSRSFRRTRRWRTELPFNQPTAMRRLPRAFLERIQALTFDEIRRTVGGYLTDREIKAVLARRDLVIARVADLVAEHGEDDVLY